MRVAHLHLAARAVLLATMLEDRRSGYMTFKLISINIPLSKGEASRKFYSALTGLEAARALSDSVEAYNIPLTHDGTWLWLTLPQDAKDTYPVAYFAVDDLQAAVKTVQDNGGQVLYGPMDMPISASLKDQYQQRLKELNVDEPITDTFGSCQLVKDPNGVVVGLVQVEPHSHIYYGLGKYENPLTPLQLGDHQRAVAFGQQLSGQKP